MGTHELSASLWRERELLELLLFKLTEEQLLLTAGHARWLQYATQEVEQVMTSLRTAGLARSIDVATVSAHLGIDENSTLRELAAAYADDAWGDILTAHLVAMTELIRDIQELRDLNAQYLRTAIRSAQESIADDGSGTGTYDANGVAEISSANARMFDLKL